LSLRMRRPVAFDAHSEIVATGRFVIVDGFEVAGGGIVALLALQVAMMVGAPIPYALYVLIAIVAVIAAGWAMLIVAVVRRRRWAKAQALALETLHPDPLAEAP